MNYDNFLKQMKQKVFNFADDFDQASRLVKFLRLYYLQEIARLASEEPNGVFKFYEDIEREDGSLDSECMPEYDAPCITTCAQLGGATFGYVGSVKSRDGETPEFSIYNAYGSLIEVRRADISLDDLVEIYESMY